MVLVNSHIGPLFVSIPLRFQHQAVHADFIAVGIRVFGIDGEAKHIEALLQLHGRTGFLMRRVPGLIKAGGAQRIAVQIGNEK